MPLVGESLDVVSRIYHTVDGVPHAEGEAYAVTDRVLAETLYGIGFVTPVGWSPDPPPPEGGARRDDRR
jgi:hypothetical protein